MSIMLGVIGNGEASDETVFALLDDLLNAADNDGRFILPVTKTHFNETLGLIADWCIENSIPFDAVTDEESASARALKKYLQAAEKTHSIKGVPLKLVNELAKAEDGRLLILWNDDDDACYDALQKADEKGVEAFDLTNGLDKLKYNDGASEGGEPAGDDPAADLYTRDELEAMDIDGLKGVVADYNENGWGIEIPARSRSGTYITKILEAQDEFLAEQGEASGGAEDTDAATAVERAVARDDDRTSRAVSSSPEVIVNSVEPIPAEVFADLTNVLERIAAAIEHLPSALGETVGEALNTLPGMKGYGSTTPAEAEQPPSTGNAGRRVPPRRS